MLSGFCRMTVSLVVIMFELTGNPVHVAILKILGGPKPQVNWKLSVADDN